MKIKTLLLTLLIVGILLFLSGCTSNNSNNETNGSPWLENYTPVHIIGTGSDDFWIEFPTGSDNYGQPIQHFDWVTNNRDNNCVLLSSIALFL